MHTNAFPMIEGCWLEQPRIRCHRVLHLIQTKQEAKCLRRLESIQRGTTNQICQDRAIDVLTPQAMVRSSRGTAQRWDTHNTDKSISNKERSKG